MNAPPDDRKEAEIDARVRAVLRSETPAPGPEHDPVILAAVAAHRQKIERTRRDVNRKRQWWMASALAASVILALAISWRMPGDPAVVRSTVSAIPTGVVSAPPREFRWVPVAAANRYRVRLFDPVARPLWESPWVETASTSFPDAERVTLRPGARYFWIVEAQGASAATELGPFSFELGEP